MVDASAGPFVVSAFVLAELDYLLATRRGVQAELAALGELASGAWELPHLDAVDVADAAATIARYQELAVGLADASLVLLAERYRTDLVLTLDQRHFGVLRTGTGGAFTLLPGP